MTINVFVINASDIVNDQSHIVFSSPHACNPMFRSTYSNDIYANIIPFEHEPLRCQVGRRSFENSASKKIMNITSTSMKFRRQRSHCRDSIFGFEHKMGKRSLVRKTLFMSLYSK